MAWPMDPVSIACLGAAVAAVYVAHAVEQREIRKALLVPSTLPMLLSSPSHTAASVRFLVVYVREVTFRRCSGRLFLGGTLSMSVQYASQGDTSSSAAACKTAEVSAARETCTAIAARLGDARSAEDIGGRATFDAACFFLSSLSSDGALPPLNGPAAGLDGRFLRLGLQRRGSCGRATVAEARLEVASVLEAAEGGGFELGVPRAVKLPLCRKSRGGCLRGKTAAASDIIGEAFVVVTMHDALREDLERCMQALGASECRGAMVAEPVGALVAGRVLSDVGAEGHIAHGIPLCAGAAATTASR